MYDCAIITFLQWAIPMNTDIFIFSSHSESSIYIRFFRLACHQCFSDVPSLNLVKSMKTSYESTWIHNSAHFFFPAKWTIMCAIQSYGRIFFTTVSGMSKRGYSTESIHCGVVHTYSTESFANQVCVFLSQSKCCSKLPWNVGTSLDK
jgi:hypothetical protein